MVEGEVGNTNVSGRGFGPTPRGARGAVEGQPPDRLGGVTDAPRRVTHRAARSLVHLSRALFGKTEGGVVVLAALFLPIAVLCVGMVVDLRAVFFARKAVQAACDLGALAGVQELDWDRLATGQVAIRETDGADVAEVLTRQNLQNASVLVEVVSVSCSVRNPPQVAEASLSVEVRFKVRTPFLGSVPGLLGGFEGRAYSGW